MFERVIALLAGLAASGCHGPQSVLDPAGRDAARIFDLLVWLGAAAALIWAAMMGVGWYAIRAERRQHSERVVRRFSVIGGVIVPVIVLTSVLAFSLHLTPALLAAGNDLEIEVTGEQFWWRIRYRMPDGTTLETANQLVLPIDRRAELELRTADVIHSFWVPALAGKIDMLPGRTTRLALEPVRLGTYRGVCAEFCGESHALMAFDVTVLSAGEFDAWLAHQQAPAAAPDSAVARSGEQLFLSNGCGACHRVAGTAADGVIGPDLTHVGGRSSLAAATLPLTQAALVRWLTHTNAVKPGVRMPAYDMLEDEELEAIARYLRGLE
jgi:cytochrome c oxidase subunit 2